MSQLFFLQENTSGYTQIWHRRCDKDWLQEGGATSLPMAVSEIQQTGMGIDLCSQTEEDSRVRQEEVNVSIFLSRNRENRRTQKTEEDLETTEGENVDLLAGLLELVAPGMTRGERQGDRELREGVVLIIV